MQVISRDNRPAPSRVTALALALCIIAAGLAAGQPALARGDDHGHRDFRGDRRHGGWGGGWHRPPPVVFGSPYYPAYGAPYYPPPVVYGPGIDIALPGIRIH